MTVIFALVGSTRVKAFFQCKTLMKLTPGLVSWDDQIIDIFYVNILTECCEEIGFYRNGTNGAFQQALETNW